MRANRITKLQTEMAAKGFDALIVTSEINQRYLTGFDYTDGLVIRSLKMIFEKMTLKNNYKE